MHHFRYSEIFETRAIILGLHKLCEVLHHAQTQPREKDILATITGIWNLESGISNLIKPDNPERLFISGLPSSHFDLALPLGAPTGGRGSSTSSLSPYDPDASRGTIRKKPRFPKLGMVWLAGWMDGSINREIFTYVPGSYKGIEPCPLGESRVGEGCFKAAFRVEEVVLEGRLSSVEMRCWLVSK